MLWRTIYKYNNSTVVVFVEENPGVYSKSFFGDGRTGARKPNRSLPLPFRLVVNYFEKISNKRKSKR